MLSNFIQGSAFDEKSREKLIFAISEKYPFAKCSIISKSSCGRNIHSIQIGAAKKSALFVGAFHGMEWLTSLLLLVFAERVCQSIKNDEKVAGISIKPFLQKKGIVIIPCINPDGVEISINGKNSAGPYDTLVESVSGGITSSWQANARGVDLNHNFNAGWEELHKLEEKRGIKLPAPTRYGGPTPESEIETKALVDFCLEKNFRHAIAFHSQGEEIYWKYGNTVSKNSELMAHIFARSSGYKLSEPEGLAVGGGFKDWFIERFNKPAFTIEIGKGKNPLPINDIHNIYSRLEEMLVFATIM
ncbi:MAG: M14 family metallocarboxypeptidase [Eubacteriales bacterium SKADARSKE-1]|nr:M14 family metallocarboxypeptidase [Eubacteriales bacterium SKADARSKE-1]